MDDKVNYFKYSTYRRFVTAFVDLSIMLLIALIAIIFSTNISVKSLNSDEKYLDSYRTMHEVFIDYGLLTKNVEESIVTYNEVYEDEVIGKVFYEFDKEEEYFKLKDDSKLFDENYQALSFADKEDLEKFYKNAYDVVSKVIYENNEEYRKAYDYYYQTSSELVAKCVASSLVGSIALFYFLIPLFNKNGKTLGKMIFSEAVIVINLENPNRLQIFIRQFIFVASTVLLIPIAISLVISMFNKDGRTIHDYLSLTRTIDSKVLKILKTKKIQEVEKKDSNGFDFKEAK